MSENLSLSKILLSIEKWDDEPKRCPRASAEALTKFLFAEKKTLVDLIGIGGEGIVLRLVDNTGKHAVAKIARWAGQQEYLATPKGNVSENPAKNKVKFSKEKPTPTNTIYLRFLEGAKFQRDVFDLLLNDQITFFSIPQVLDISLSPLYFTMPYLENIGVLRFFHDFQKKIKDILLVFLNLLRATSYLHSKGIIHRDWKSDNLLISRSMDSVVVCDWTLAKICGNRGLTLPGTRGGTPGFAPGKFMDGDFLDANFRDDIFQLGWVFWEFVTGKRLPDYLRNTKEKNEEIKSRLIDFLSDFLQPVFWKATETKETDRYESVNEFYQDVKNIADDLGEKNILTLVSEKQSQEIDKRMQDIIVDTHISASETDIYECENCGECGELFPCKTFKKSVVDIVLEMIEKGLI